ncbi:hypothetical protein [Rhodococcus koreensis]|uniref:hypothetical protein n=1 Tax=Rhodococcus koreensis TaxID=99653 RepID=UPI0036D9B3B9
MKLTEHAVEQCSRVAITTVTPGKVVRAGRAFPAVGDECQTNLRAASRLFFTWR